MIYLLPYWAKWVLGKLLREVEPDLMDTLIRATKDGDQKTLQALAGSTPQVNACNGDELEEMHCDDQEQVCILYCIVMR